VSSNVKVDGAFVGHDGGGATAVVEAAGRRDRYSAGRDGIVKQMSTSDGT
jgi:hypothetical protein